MGPAQVQSASVRYAYCGGWPLNSIIEGIYRRPATNWSRPCPSLRVGGKDMSMLLYLLIAFRLRFCTVYAGNWHALRRVHAWNHRGRDDRANPFRGFGETELGTVALSSVHNNGLCVLRNNNGKAVPELRVGACQSHTVGRPGILFFW